MSAHNEKDIAIVGIGCRFAGSNNLQDFWLQNYEAKNSFSPVPNDRWDNALFFDQNLNGFDKSNAPHGAFLDNIKLFSAKALGISTYKSEVMDPQQRIALEVSLQAIEDSGYRPEEMPVRTGVYMGATAVEYRSLLASRVLARLMANGSLGTAPADIESVLSSVNHLVPARPATASGLLANMIAATISQHLDFKGPAYTVDAACASSLVTIADAVFALRAGHIDSALAGGVYICSTPEHHVAFSQLGAMSKLGICSPFDEHSDGFVQGDGCGILVLKRLDDAIHDGDRIYSVIKGIAVNNSGRGSNAMAPVEVGESQVIDIAWNDAGMDPAELGYLECHGTGTDVGDRVEIAGLLDSCISQSDRLVLGSGKANIGHTMSAAGVAGIIRAALGQYYSCLLPTANLNKPRSELHESPFTINKQPVHWTDTQRIAAVSAFGFGGTNVHAVLNSYDDDRNQQATLRLSHLVMLSASNMDELKKQVVDTVQALEIDRPAELSGVSVASACRVPLVCRLGIIAATTEELITKLKHVLENITPSTDTLIDKSLPEINIGYSISHEFNPELINEKCVTRFPDLIPALKSLNKSKDNENLDLALTSILASIGVASNGMRAGYNPDVIHISPVYFHRVSDANLNELDGLVYISENGELEITLGQHDFDFADDESILSLLNHFWVLGADVDTRVFITKRQVASMPPSLLPKESYWAIKQGVATPVDADVSYVLKNNSGLQTQQIEHPNFAKLDIELDSVFDLIRDAIQLVSSYTESDIKRSTRLVENLDFDSITIAELEYELDKKFNGIGELASYKLVEDITLEELELFIKQQITDSISKTRLEEDNTKRQSQPGIKWSKIENWPEYRTLKERIGGLDQNNIFNMPYQGIARDTAVIDNKEVISFSSYNYLGFSGDERINTDVTEALNRYGTSVSASRVASGERPFHRELEKEISLAIGAENSLLFPSGYSTNVATIGHLFGPLDLIVYDALIHDSCRQGMKLSGASLRSFHHNNPEHLEEILQRHRNEYQKTLILVEGVYSMDGDIAQIPEFIKLREKYDCLLMVDEAHSFGTLGASGFGVREHFDISPSDVDIWMGTLSKTLASMGGWISGSNELIEYMRYTTPGFVFAAGLAPPLGQAALSSLRLMCKEPERIKKLRNNSERLFKHFQRMNLSCGYCHGQSSVIPLITGDTNKTLIIAKQLLDSGIDVKPIVAPAVAEDQARLRFFVSSLHSEEQIDYTASQLARILG